MAESGRRRSPAKGVGGLSRLEGSNPSLSASGTARVKTTRAVLVNASLDPEVEILQRGPSAIGHVDHSKVPSLLTSSSTTCGDRSGNGGIDGHTTVEIDLDWTDPSSDSIISRRSRLRREIVRIQSKPRGRSDSVPSDPTDRSMWNGRAT